MWLRSLSDRPIVPHSVMKASPDGVFPYASAVLNDGLLLMVFLDAIKEGDGERIMRCWKFISMQQVTLSVDSKPSISWPVYVQQHRHAYLTRLYGAELSIPRGST